MGVYGVHPWMSVNTCVKRRCKAMALDAKIYAVLMAYILMAYILTISAKWDILS
jgi:hypothetical protein